MKNIIFLNRNLNLEKFNRIYRIKKFDLEEAQKKETEKFYNENVENLNSSISINARIELKQKHLKDILKVWIESLIDSFGEDIVTTKDATYIEIKFKSFIKNYVERERNGLKSALLSYGTPDGSIISDLQASINNELNKVGNVSLDVLRNEIDNHNNKINKLLQHEKINFIKPQKIKNNKRSISAKRIMKKLPKAEKEEFNTLIRMAERYITSSHKVKGSTVRKWSKRSLNWLKQNYTETSYPNEFLLIPEPSHYSDVGLSTGDVLRIQKKLAVLLKTQNKIEKEVTIINNPEVLNSVFIVHGKNNSIKEEIARFIEKLKLKPIILHEQPNKGRTIIEKFLEYSNVGFAIILLTPDDKGGLAKEPSKKYKLRARQNVIFELGYFIGKLGREKVSALYVPGVEIPSDYSGILFIQIDNSGNWKLQLAKEIKSSGIKVDLNTIM